MAPPRRGWTPRGEAGGSAQGKRLPRRMRGWALYRADGALIPNDGPAHAGMRLTRALGRSPSIPARRGTLRRDCRTAHVARVIPRRGNALRHARAPQPSPAGTPRWRRPCWRRSSKGRMRHGGPAPVEAPGQAQGLRPWGQTACFNPRRSRRRRDHERGRGPMSTHTDGHPASPRFICLRPNWGALGTNPNRVAALGAPDRLARSSGPAGCLSHGLRVVFRTVGATRRAALSLPRFWAAFRSRLNCP